jgi:hypothetical protein
MFSSDQESVWAAHSCQQAHVFPKSRAYPDAIPPARPLYVRYRTERNEELATQRSSLSHADETCRPTFPTFHKKPRADAIKAPAQVL